MELLLIKHAEVRTDQEDPKLTNLGMVQATITSEWLASNFNLRSFLGFVSPYYGCLQTASVIEILSDIPFHVDPRVGDYRKGFINNHSITFSNLYWNLSFFDDDGKIVFDSSPEDFLLGMEKFVLSLEENYEQVVIVTHPAIIRVMIGLITAPNRESFLETAKNDLSNNLFSIADCSVTYISGKELVVPPKVVF